MVREDWEEADYFRKKEEEAILRRMRERNQMAAQDSERVEEDLFSIKMYKSLGPGHTRMPSTSAARDEDDDVSPLWESNNRLCNNGRDQVAAKSHVCEDNVLASELVAKSDIASTGKHDGVYLPESYALYSSETPSDDVGVENTLAMVPYSGNVFSEIICSLQGLGLKRSAEGELELPHCKRRKACSEEITGPEPAISVYARNLRKVKTRMRS
ncbi:hypothetical protein K1719_027431 [Acacia pycnantha]|nr:hypothetical protein K1719_027431 [Acacia pycnantha]